jgi:RNA polymerase sigma factor (sigma-70 family)
MPASIRRRRSRVVAREARAGPNGGSAEVRVGTLFDEHAPMVLAVCRYLLRDPQAAEDAAQETFLSAHRSLLRGTQPRDPAAWLATIARNHCRHSRRRTPTAPLDEGTTGINLDPAEIVANRAEFSAVASAIAALPPRQREALVMRELCGLSYEQVAAAMSVSESAVESLLSRARRRLVETVGYVPRAARGALVVPASFREELSRLIPGLDPAGAAAGVASGASGAAALASLGSAPVTAKVAATSVAAVALALPVQATVREDGSARAAKRPAVATQAAGPEHSPRRAPAREVTPGVPAARGLPEGRHVVPEGSRSSGPGPRAGGAGPDSSRHGSGPGSDSSGSGSSDTGSSGPGGSGSGGSGSGGSGSGGSGSSSSGSSSSGSGSGGSGGSGSSGDGD